MGEDNTRAPVSLLVVISNSAIVKICVLAFSFAVGFCAPVAVAVIIPSAVSICRRRFASPTGVDFKIMPRVMECFVMR